MNQLALDFERPKGRAPVVRQFQVDEVVAQLRGKGWQKAVDLGFRTESERRILRAIAEAADHLIISGQKGYKLTVEATPEEMESFKWLREQSRKNLRRYLRTVRFWHRSAHTENAEIRDPRRE